MSAATGHPERRPSRRRSRRTKNQNEDRLTRCALLGASSSWVLFDRANEIFRAAMRVALAQIDRTACGK
jgi:hypothetical protein